MPTETEKEIDLLVTDQYEGGDCKKILHGIHSIIEKFRYRLHCLKDIKNKSVRIHAMSLYRDDTYEKVDFVHKEKKWAPELRNRVRQEIKESFQRIYRMDPGVSLLGIDPRLELACRLKITEEQEISVEGLILAYRESVFANHRNQVKRRKYFLRKFLKTGYISKHWETYKDGA